MTDDMIEEEMQIANEQDGKAEKVLSSKTFELPLGDLKTPEAITVERGVPVKEVIGIMQENRIGSVLVVEEGFLVGIVTERDILMKVAGKNLNLETTLVDQVMTEDPLALMPKDMIAYVMNNMHVGGYRHVPVVDENRHPVSIISIKDIMSFILDYFPEEVTNITGEPYRGPVSRDSA